VAGNVVNVQFTCIKTRSGIKLYILSESKSGYIWNRIIYCGKVVELKGSENLKYTSKAVQTLCEEFLLRATQYMWILSNPVQKWAFHLMIEKKNK